MDADAKNRLWQFALHEDTQFNERQNFFLLAESLFAVAFAGSLQVEELTVSRAIAIVAGVLSATWLRVSHRQLHLMEIVQKEACINIPEYARVRAQRSFTILPSRYIVGYFVPLLISAMWIVLLLIVY